MLRSISEDEQMLAAGYILGDLSAVESREFESALANDPALQSEVEALQIAFNKLPEALPQYAPPPSLKAKIIESFAAVAVLESAENLSQPIVDKTNLVTRKTHLWLKALAGIGLFTSGYLLFDNFRLRQELQLANRVDRQELATVIQQPTSRLVALKDRTDRSVGNILFTPGKWQKVIVSAQKLPPLPVDRIYRMWLELNNGQILPCGEFNTDADGNVFVKLNAQQDPPQGVKARGVFVTIDRADAPLTPTGDRVIQGTI